MYRKIYMIMKYYKELLLKRYNMEKQFVTYEIAIKLKEIGFDKISRFGNETSLYNKDGKFTFYCNYGFMYSGLNDRYIYAPLWQQVEEWLEEQQIYIYYIDDLTYGYNQDYNDISYKILDRINNYILKNTCINKILARQEAISKALNILDIRNKNT